MNSSQPHQIKEALNRQFARIGHAISSPKRLEILELLYQCEKSVESLARTTTMSIANTSRHLQVLRSAGLVETRKEGIYVIYRLADEAVFDLIRNMRSVAENHLADLDRVLADLYKDMDQPESMDRERLTQLAKSGRIVVLDVRPEDEFTAAHIPYAVSIPLDKLSDSLNKLPRDQQIVAYCRGPYCLLANEAVKLLKSHGFQAIRLGEGIAEWKAAGQPVVAGKL